MAPEPKPYESRHYALESQDARASTIAITKSEAETARDLARASGKRITDGNPMQARGEFTEVYLVDDGAVAITYPHCYGEVSPTRVDIHHRFPSGLDYLAETLHLPRPDTLSSH